MRVAILGGPGSGKGTQAKILAERYRVPQISTGDLLREALKNNEILNEETKRAMAEGRLVDDQVVLKLLEERLRKRDTKRGFIIDGYPRNIPQAQALDTLLGMLDKTLQIAINIDVDDDALVKRIVGRMGCDHCGAIYNKYFSPPNVKNKCDRCGGVLASRVDDTAKTARVRIGVYHEETMPLITYYRAQHKLRTMPGLGEVDEIHQKLCDVVDLEIRPLEIKTLETAADTNDEMDSTIIAGGQINRVELDTVVNKASPKKRESTRAATQAGKKTVRKKVAGKIRPEKKVAAKKSKAAKKTTQKKKAASKSMSKAVTRKKPISKKVTRKPAKKKAPAKPVVSRSKKVAKKKAAPKKTTRTKIVKKGPAKKIIKKTAKKKAAPKKTTGTKIVKKGPAKKITKRTAKKKVARKTR